MTINPKLKIVSGVALAGGGAFMFYQANKATDKKKKLMYGLAGAGLIISGFFVGKKGVIQVIGLNRQGKANDDANNPAKAITADMVKEKAEVKPNNNKVERENTQRTAPLAFNNREKNLDSFDTIMQSASPNGAPPSSVQSKPKNNNVVQKNDTIKARNNGSVTSMGIKVVDKLDAKILERNSQRRQLILNQISEKEKQNKILIKASGWHAGLPLRNEISILKAQLFHN